MHWLSFRIRSLTIKKNCDYSSSFHGYYFSNNFIFQVKIIETTLELIMVSERFHRGSI